MKYRNTKKEAEKILASFENQKINEKVLDFTKFFIEKVLKAEAEVDFETRLKLETSVRDLNNEEILTQWKKFTESETENQAQEEVKNLLEILIKNIKP